MWLGMTEGYPKEGPASGVLPERPFRFGDPTTKHKNEMGSNITIAKT
jgi:hypothetical protein